MSNVYDHAYDLEKALRESDEYQKLKQAYDDVQQDSAARHMFVSFQNMQKNLQQRQMQGERVTKEEAENIQQQMQTVQRHPLIGKLMEEERRLGVLLNDINQIISKPLEDLYGKAGIGKA
ncbi:YlbF family regulator [Camelliibacillus cellulosilyticus]|uniref:UPF0342 protein ACFO4N_10080 n=1 Tax=Camelliibacillus cellulosilyticus TaxID=2174486 RepID=A0ABV9GQY6_9BACL